MVARSAHRAGPRQRSHWDSQARTASPARWQLHAEDDDTGLFNLAEDAQIVAHNAALAECREIP
jgi:hypothetical protein